MVWAAYEAAAAGGGWRRLAAAGGGWRRLAVCGGETSVTALRKLLQIAVLFIIHSLFMPRSISRGICQANSCFFRFFRLMLWGWWAAVGISN